jgi:hypothetical protein
MEIDNSSTDNFQETKTSSPVLKTVSWVTDVGISSLSKDIFSHSKDQQDKVADSGELENELPDYKQPKDLITSNTKINQRIRFNLIVIAEQWLISLPSNYSNPSHLLSKQVIHL